MSGKSFEKSRKALLTEKGLPVNRQPFFVVKYVYISGCLLRLWHVKCVAVETETVNTGEIKRQKTAGTAERISRRRWRPRGRREAKDSFPGFKALQKFFCGA